MPSSRGSSQPRDQTQVSCIAGGFINWATSQFSFQSQRKAMPKNVQTTIQLCPFHTLSKVNLKILQERLQQYKNWALPDVQAGFRNGRGTRDQIANIQWITEKSKGIPEKHLLLLHYTKAFDYVQQTEKFLKRWDYQTTLPVPRNLCAGQETTVRTGSKLGKD